MAESSQPNTGLILKVGGIGIVAVLVIRLGLMSYFGFVDDAEYTRKYVDMGQAARDVNVKAKAEEMAALAGGPMPIDKAMQLIATDNRAVPGLEPHPADPMREKDTLAGWAQMPREVPSSLMMARAAAPPPWRAARPLRAVAQRSQRRRRPRPRCLRPPLPPRRARRITERHEPRRRSSHTGHVGVVRRGDRARAERASGAARRRSSRRD